MWSIVTPPSTSPPTFVVAACVAMTLMFRRYGAVLLIAILVFYLVFREAANHDNSHNRLEQLQAQNSKLHENIQLLSEELDKTGRGQERRGTGEIQKRRTGVIGLDQIDSLSECDVIHIAMVVSGYITIQRAMVVVKSILFYRQDILHFHFLTDARGKEILSTIFGTWLLPMVSVSFYSITDAIRMVKSIPNSHYSGIFALTKLTLPSILPGSLRAVIVLDTDLLFAADIGNLWKILRRLREGNKMLGLVENQSDWYLGDVWKVHKPWPAIGRGFNTGVILVNLELMRERNWKEIWHRAAKECLSIHHKTALADQDVVNAAAKREGNLVFILPCVWNIQLSENTLSSSCYKSAHHFKVIHWNSAAKLDVKNSHGPHFKNMYTMFENYESTLFRTHLSDCSSGSSFNPVADESDHSDPCFKFRFAVRLVYRVHPLYLEFSYESNGRNDVTLVAQMSMNRLHMLEPLCKSWGGPLSIALYATDADLRLLTSLIAASPFLNDFKKLALHVVFREGKFYPVNRLRNIALDAAITPFVYLSDIDFLPASNLYHYIKEAITVLGTSQRALIIPAFQSLLYRMDFPTNKTELISMLEKKQVYTFRYHVWKQGHSPTNFEHWKKSARPFRVHWVEPFEPYVVVHRNVTRYDERFVGFGWNKVSHMMELNAQRYEFVVLPEAFMIHMPHSPSTDMTTFRRSKNYRDCMQVLKEEFRKELVMKYGPI